MPAITTEVIERIIEKKRAELKELEGKEHALEARAREYRNRQQTRVNDLVKRAAEIKTQLDVQQDYLDAEVITKDEHEKTTAPLRKKLEEIIEEGEIGDERSKREGARIQSEANDLAAKREDVQRAIARHEETLAEVKAIERAAPRAA